jgi:F420-dependent oxidoreductase-like protein
VKTAVGIAAAGVPLSWGDTLRFVEGAERLGVDFAWSAEAWGRDAATPLAYLAARTTRIWLGSGILQVSARTPTMTAMTALTLAELSGNRFALGLGASGPQVVEALHGIPFAGQLERVRETVEICRLAFRGEPIVYRGRHYVLPRPGGAGRPLRVATHPNPRLPIYLGALSPAGLRLTGELADGWLGHHFVPEAAAAFFGPLAEGARKAGRRLGDLDLQAGGWVEFGDDLGALIQARRPYLAFSLGAMGSREKNFYTETYVRAGFQEPAREVQRLWLAGERDKAIAAVPAEMVRATQLIGTPAQVRERIGVYRELGITTLRLQPAGRDVREQLQTLERAVALVREVCGPPA